MAETFAASPFGAPLRLLGRRWWLLLLRGLALVLFGVAAFASPGLTFLTLVLMFGIYALADGATALLAAIFGGGVGGRWWLALSGLVSIAAGLVALMAPGLGGLSIVALIGAWCAVRGVAEILGAIALRKAIRNEWALALGGTVSLMFGLAILARPVAGAVAILWVVGTWALIAGGLSVLWAFRLRRLA